MRSSLLILVCATVASPARLELIQTESHLLPLPAASGNATKEPIKVEAAREMAAAAAPSLEFDRDEPADSVGRRILVAPIASQTPPTAAQRMMHPFRRMAVEMIASGSAAQMAPMELVMTCSVVAMGVLGIAW